MEPALEPEKKPNRILSLLGSTLKWILALLVVAAIAAAAAYLVFEWLIQTEQQSTASQVALLRQEIRQQQDELEAKMLQVEAKMAQVEKSATETGLLLNENGETTGLDARLKEIETLRLDLQKSQAETDAKLKALEQSVRDQVSQQGQETAQALALELKWKNLVVKAQGEVMLAQVYWSEGNRGLAKDELSVAVQSLQEAMSAAPEPDRTVLKEVFALGEQTKASLILEQSSARDALNLLWHRVNDLLGTAGGQ